MTKHSWFREYCEKTTANCMEYFVMKQRSLIEKIFWIFNFLLVLFLSTTNIMTVINVWINNPTIIVIENTESSIHDIPFPSITICSSNQIRTSVWERYTNLNSSYREFIHYYQAAICTGHKYASAIKHPSSEYFDYEMIKNFFKDSPVSCPELFQSTEVKWQNSSTKNFCSSVQPVSSMIGLCFKTNMVPANQMFNDKYYERYSSFFSQNIISNRTKTPFWSLDDGYKVQYNDDDFLFDTLPARTSGVSYYHRLVLRLHILNNVFQSCPNLNVKNGFFLVVYNTPVELPTIHSRTVIMPDTYTKVQITPFVKKVSSDLKSYSPSIRQCYFENERKLLLFKYYSEINCVHECIRNETLSKCGCIQLDLAFLGVKGEKICGTSKLSCAKDAIAKVRNSRTQQKCGCLPTCTVINYEITDTPLFDDWEYLKTAKLVHNNSRGATIEFIFKHPYFTAYQVNSIFNTYSLISVIGGLLGLFLGINIINVFELLYVLSEIMIYYIVHTFSRR